MARVSEVCKELFREPSKFLLGPSSQPMSAMAASAPTTAASGERRGPSDARPDARRDASQRRLAIVQRGELATRARALDAYDHRAEPVVGARGVPAGAGGAGRRCGQCFAGQL